MGVLWNILRVGKILNDFFMVRCRVGKDGICFTVPWSP
jgi:hypothetical protein